MKTNASFVAVIATTTALCFATFTPEATAAATKNVTAVATSFTGTDASISINACINSVIAGGGGVCDATGFGGTQKMSEEIDVGTTSSVAAGVGVTLLLPDTALWMWKVSDSASCGIRQRSSTAVLGNEPAGGGERMVLTAASGSSMDSIYCTDAPANGANYVRAEGFAVENNQPGNTFANGVVHIRDVVDQSSFTGIFAENYYGDVWHIDSACCGATFDKIQGTSNGSTNINNGSQGGVPLTVGPGKVDGVSFHNSGFNAPGIGLPDIHIQGYGYQTLVFGVNFYNTYMEGNGTLDQTTAMILIDPYVGPIHFYGGTAKTEQSSLAKTKYIFENHGYMLDVPGGFEAISTTAGIHDVTANSVVPVWAFNGNLGSIPAYTTKH